LTSLLQPAGSPRRLRRAARLALRPARFLRHARAPRAAFPPRFCGLLTPSAPRFRGKQLDAARAKAAQEEGKPAPAPKAEAKLTTAQRIGLGK
jgi:hypothetical protein